MPIQDKKRSRMTLGQITVLLVLSFILILLISIVGILYLGSGVLSFVHPIPKTPLPETAPINVFIDVSVDSDTNIGKPIVSGRTNLPDGTIIMLTVRGESNMFVGQDKVYVTNGTFKSTQFVLPESPFDIDKYKVEALMPYANVQSESVRRVIGNTGERLTGKYVQRDSTGTLVQNTTNFEIHPRLINLVGPDIGKRKIDSPNGDFSYAITLVRAYITNKIFDLISTRVGYNDFVVVEIVYENLGIYSTDLLAEDFMLNIQDGIEGNTSPYSRGMDGMSFYMPAGAQNTDYLETVTVEPGDNFHGLIVFENPRETQTYVLTLRIPCATDCDYTLIDGVAFKFSKSN